MTQEEEVLDQMRGIIDPDLGKDIVSLGFIKNLTISGDGEVAFDVELTTPACPVKDHFRSSCRDAVRRLPWVQSVDVTMTAAAKKPATQAQGAGLQRVTNLIAVASCKGGVGKSTTAVNLAYALRQAGARVGIFDADVYGPSLPTMVQPAATELYQQGEMIVPLEHEGVKLMSFGFVPQAGGGAAIMRGPMVSSVINQLVTSTNWGELDYLILDLPPGTGDIQLTICQLLPLTAAVIVTTPQDLSFVDVVKGIQMFEKLKVDTVAIVENMSYFVCDQCSKLHHLFGKGAREKLVRQFGFQNTFEVPLEPEISRWGDAGRPVMLTMQNSAVTQIYGDLCAAVVREVSKIQHGGLTKPTVRYERSRGIVVELPDGEEHVIAPAELRRRCRCAHCVDEMSGDQILQPEDISEDVYPTSIHSMGNYAVAIAWSDGHTSSIYAYDTLIPAPTVG